MLVEKGRVGLGKPDPFHPEVLLHAIGVRTHDAELGHCGRVSRVWRGPFRPTCLRGKASWSCHATESSRSARPDVAATRDVLVSAFGLTEVETRGANGLAILCDDAGLELVISRPTEKFGGADTVSVGRNTYHIGFMLPSREAVDAQYERAKAAGCEMGQPPAAMRGGWSFYCFAPGQILIEVGWRSE